MSDVVLTPQARSTNAPNTRPAHILTQSVTVRGIVNMSAVASVQVAAHETEQVLKHVGVLFSPGPPCERGHELDGVAFE